jgi:hypothetical protein
MRKKKRFTKWLAAVAAVALTLWLVSPSQAESGCHKIKGKGKGGSVQTVQTVN